MFKCTHKNGFTLIELLIAMVISSFVMAAIYATYNAQLKSHVTQQIVVEMHQNARAAMFMLERELRMAGYNPLGIDDPATKPSITTAQINAIAFTMDITGGETDLVDNDDDGLIDEPGETDGDTNDAFEQIRYQLSNDSDDDGVADSMNCSLQRQYWNGAALITNPDDVDVSMDIDALNFVYLDEDGDDLIDYSGAFDPPQVPPADLDKIRVVQITIVARAGQNERQGLPGKQTDSKVYMNQQDRPGDDWDIILPAPNDRYRRIVLTADVKCRNMGLN
jgi:type IV pilus assembly protein PilW